MATNRKAKQRHIDKLKREVPKYERSIRELTNLYSPKFLQDIISSLKQRLKNLQAEILKLEKELANER